MSEPDGLVAPQALSSERVQQVHLSLSHGNTRTSHRLHGVRTLTGGGRYLVENAEEVVGPLGPRRQRGVGADERVVTKRRLVDVVEGTDLLVGRVFPAAKGNGEIQTLGSASTLSWKHSDICTGASDANMEASGQRLVARGASGAPASPAGSWSLMLIG